VATPNLPSDIQGRISANGQVWLVNPSGIFIGAGAKIDVAGFLATTHDISNADFMAGRHRFGTGTQPAGSVENEGTITIAEAGLAALVAPHVANRGVIAARLGQVALASGNAFTVDFAGDGLISFAVTAPVTAPVIGRDGKVVPALVENAGQIHADGGRVLLTASAAKGIVERAISMSGVVQARSVTRHADWARAPAGSRSPARWTPRPPRPPRRAGGSRSRARRWRWRPRRGSTPRAPWAAR
jgi:large exoprotein involved in heme utilization and adhesion